MQNLKNELQQAHLLPVYIPICASHVQMATRTVSSLIENCRERISLKFLSDGTLTSRDIEQLHSKFPVATIIGTEESENLVVPELKRRPNCLAFRRGHPFGRKLIDPPFLHCSDRFLLCDADVLFIRPFSGLEHAMLGNDIVYMRELQNTYSIIYRHRYLRWPTLRLPEGLNAGFLLSRKSAVDYDMLEWFLSQRKLHTWPWLVEQTAWGLLAGRVRSGEWSRSQVRVPDINETDRSVESAIAIHFLGQYRRLIDTWRWSADTSHPTCLTVEPSEYMSFFKATYQRIAARLYNRQSSRSSN